MNKFIVVISMLWALAVNSTLLPQEIKGLYTIFKPNHMQLSLLPGLIWAQGGVIENLAEIYQDDQNAHVTLTKRLFYRVDRATFTSTRAESNAASYFTPSLMGQIAARLHNFQNIEPENKDRSLLVFRLLEIISPATKEKLDTLTKIIATEKDAQKLENLEKIKSNLEKSTKSYPQLFIDALNAATKNISVFKIIGAFVYYKSSNKNELLEYYQGIAQELDPESIFIDMSFLTDGKQRWLDDNFTLADKVFVISADKPYEQLAFALMTSTDWIAPYLTGFDMAYPETPIALGFGLPNCGENSLLNFYRVLFGKEDSASIDMPLVKAVSPRSKLLGFFKSKVAGKEGLLSFSSLGDLRSKKAQDSFVDITANIKNLCEIGDVYVNRDEYRQIKRPKEFQCEIKSDFYNINLMIKELNGVDFNMLIAEINKRTDDNFAVIKKLDSHGLGTINIKTKDRGEFEWILKEGHFFFTPVIQNTLANQPWQVLLNIPEPARDLLALLPITADKISEQLNMDDASYLVLLNKLDNDDALVKYLDENLLHSLVKIDGLLKRVQSEDAHIRIRNLVMSSWSFEAAAKYIKWIGNQSEPFFASLLNKPDFRGETALHYAVNNEKLVELLLPRMSQETIDGKDLWGGTALHKAFSFEILEGDIVQKFREKSIGRLLKKMSPKAINSQDFGKNTALHYAVISQSINLVTLLLNNMSTEEIYTINSSGDTPLYNAAFYGKDEILELFLDRSPAAINAKLKDGKTVLQIAATHKNLGNIKLILRLYTGSFKNFDFDGLNMKDFNFSGQDLRWAKFANSEIDGGNFSEARLHGASFKGATLKNIDLRGVHLSFEQLEGATLCNVELPLSMLELIKKLELRAGECTLI